MDIQVNESCHQSFSESELEAVQQLSRIAVTAVQDVMNSVLPVRVEISAAVINTQPLKSIKTTELTPAMFIKANNQDTKRIPAVLLCKQEFVRKVINGIMGTDNASLTFDEFDLGTASELLAQASAQMLEAMSAATGKVINAYAPTITLFKNYGDFLQGLRLTSDAEVFALSVDVSLQDVKTLFLFVADMKVIKSFTSQITVSAAAAITPNTAAAVKKEVKVQEEAPKHAEPTVTSAVPQAESPKTVAQPAQETKAAPIPESEKAVEVPRIIEPIKPIVTPKTVLPQAESPKTVAQPATQEVKAVPKIIEPVKAAAPVVAEVKSELPKPQVQAPQTVPSESQIEEYDNFETTNMELIQNVPLNINVEIGRTKRKLKEIIEFSQGTIIELQKDSDSPVDIYIDGEMFARGKVYVMDENFNVQITEILTYKEILANRSK